jgi:hypothetical protein
MWFWSRYLKWVPANSWHESETVALLAAQKLKKLTPACMFQPLLVLLRGVFKRFS